MPDSVINSIVTKYDGSDLDVNELIENVNDDVQSYIDQVVEQDVDFDMYEKQQEEHLK